MRSIRSHAGLFARRPSARATLAALSMVLIAACAGATGQPGTTPVARDPSITSDSTAGVPADSARLAELAARERERILSDARSRVDLERGLPPPLPVRSPQVRIAIVATNDFHGALLPLMPVWADGDTVGGAATLAAYVRWIESRYPGATLHLDGGDVMQGTAISNLARGRSTVDVLNAIGVDAAAIGNHEFDWGIDTLEARIAQAAYPWLSANIFVKATGVRPEWAEPYAWVERAGLRIALIGATTIQTPEATLPTHVEALEFRDIATVVNELAPRLEAEGADLVIVVAHAGAIPLDDGTYVGEIIDAARRIRGSVDLIVSGHTHTHVDTEVAGIPIVQARSSGTALGVVVLTYDRRVGDVVDYVVEVWTTDDDAVAADSAIARTVQGWEDRVAAVADRPIGRTAIRLERGRLHESALGDLIADAQRWATGDPIAIVNGGGIRSDLQEGELTYRDVFAVQPFENVLVRLTLTGAQLERALEAVVGDQIGQVSGIRFSYDPTRPVGDQVVDAWLEAGEVPVVADGRVVEPDRLYGVTANSFMVAGGSGYDVLGEALEVTPTGLIDSQILIDYLAQLPQPIVYELQGRIEPLAPWPSGTGD